MRLNTFVRCGGVIVAALIVVRCSRVSDPIAPVTPPPVTSVVTGVRSLDGTAATQEAGAPPPASGGPAVTATGNSTVSPGGAEIALLQSAVPFQTVYVSVPNTSGLTAQIAEQITPFGPGRVTPAAVATGYFQLRLPAPVTNLQVFTTVAPTVTIGSTFTLAYAVASASGAVGATVTAAKTVSNSTCSFSVNPTTIPFDSTGGAGAVSIAVTGSGCTWTAATSATFVTITQGATGTASGTVQFTVGANSTGSARSATLNVAGTTVTVTQSAGTLLGAPTANSPIGGIVLAPIVVRPTLIVNNAAATGNLGSITYRFEISDLSSFPVDPVRTFTADGIPQGNGTTSWVVNRDLGPSVLWFWHARATNGTITGPYSPVETFRTSDPPCNYTVSPTSATAAGAGDSIAVTITRTTGACGWTAESDVPWITGPSSSAAGGVFTYTIVATSAPRTGRLTISWAGGSTVVTIAQAAPAVQCTYALTNPVDGNAQVTVPSQGGSFNAKLTATPESCAWTLAVDQNPQGMLTIGSATSGTGSTTISFRVAPNNFPDPQRTGTIRVSGSSGSAVYTVIQQPNLGIRY
jgi:hypothetical protein